MQPQVTIHVSTPDSPASVHTFTQPRISIGRTRDHKDGTNDIVLPAPRVSGRHAHVIVTPEGLTLIDHSSNGTAVNGELIAAPRLLSADDRVEIDAYTLRFELQALQPQPFTPPPAPARSQPIPTPAEDRPPPPLAVPAPLGPLVPDDAPPRITFPSSEPSTPGVAPSLLPRIDPDAAPSLISSPATPPSHGRTQDPSSSPPSLSPPSPIASPTPTPPIDLIPAPRDLTPPSPATPSPTPVPSVSPPPSSSVSPPPAHTSHDPLARLYRTLAARHGASWGRPPALDATSIAPITALAREAAAHERLPPGPWPEHIARELCGLGPLGPLLDDPAVTRAIVRGAAPIEVHRGPDRERTHVHFSCPEALHAVLERWTGARLTGALDLLLEGSIRLHAWDAPLSATGPLLILERLAGAPPTLDDLIADRVLPQAAADLLRLALQRDLNILIHGRPAADLGLLLVALAGATPPTASLTALRRGSIWPLGQATLLDGHDPAAWPCAHRLAADWLVLDELAPADLPDLVAIARHPGGGTLASLRAPTAEAALQRLTAAFAATHAGDLSAARSVVGGCFDAVISVHRTPANRLRVQSIAEVRARGELAELFAWRPDAAAIEPTAIDPQVIR